MQDVTAQLSSALADRYRIERHLGEGWLNMIPVWTPDGTRVGSRASGKGGPLRVRSADLS